jgi:rhodanese-related sulfurtransferase
MRGLIATVVAAAVLLVGAAPAAIPEGPINFIKVDELKTLVDQGRRVDLIDVRHWDSYVEMHIKGARSMPLRVIEERAPREVSRTGLVVFY